MSVWEKDNLLLYCRDSRLHKGKTTKKKGRKGVQQTNPWKATTVHRSKSEQKGCTPAWKLRKKQQNQQKNRDVYKLLNILQVPWTLSNPFPVIQYAWCRMYDPTWSVPLASPVPPPLIIPSGASQLIVCGAGVIMPKMSHQHSGKGDLKAADRWEHPQLHLFDKYFETLPGVPAPNVTYQCDCAGFLWTFLLHHRLSFFVFYFVVIVCLWKEVCKISNHDAWGRTQRRYKCVWLPAVRASLLGKVIYFLFSLVEVHATGKANHALWWLLE